MKSENTASGHLLLNNQWIKGTGTAFSSTNPATNAIIWQGFSASSADVDAAVTFARAAFLAWSDLPLIDRLQFIKAFQRELEQHKETLANIIHEETGKPLWETATEITAMIGKIDISVQAYHERTGQTKSEKNGVTVELQHRPHGVTAVFGPFNFPGHLPNGHIVPALIAGNTVVFKPSEQTPKTGEFIMRLWQNTQIPAGVIQLLQGEKHTGIALSEHPNIDGIFFTGSSTTGATLQQEAAKNFGKILALELGGHNPLVVNEISNIKAAVYSALQSCFITAGQRCTCAKKLILIQSKNSEAFLQQFIQAASQLELTLNSPQGFMGPVIHKEQAQKLLKKQSDLLEKGAQSLLLMEQPNPELAFVTPGIIDVTDIDVIDEEDFGPLLKIYRVPNLLDAITEANNTRYGLSAGLLSENATDWAIFQKMIRAGIVNWNKPTTGASGKAPFGGRGASGNYRPGAYYAADYCAYPMASVSEESATLPLQLLPGVHLE